MICGFDSGAAEARRALEAGNTECLSGEPVRDEARRVIDELIGEVGGITDEDRVWARAALQIDSSADSA